MDGWCTCNGQLISSCCPLEVVLAIFLRYPVLTRSDPVWVTHLPGHRHVSHATQNTVWAAKARRLRLTRLHVDDWVCGWSTCDTNDRSFLFPVHLYLTFSVHSLHAVPGHVPQNVRILLYRGACSHKLDRTSSGTLTSHCGFSSRRNSYRYSLLDEWISDVSF